jgi:high frequency lysogenization protein
MNAISNSTINDRMQEKTLALAGIFQAAALVKLLAKTGKSLEPFFKQSIESLFKTDANDVPEVFGGIENVRLGLEELVRLFSQHNPKVPKDGDMARYVLSILHLERKIQKQTKMLNQIQTGIERAKNQAAIYSTTHENVIANLASIYTDTAGSFKFRIYVAGEPLYLNQTHMVNKIRALLFAGIRSAVLWRQMGGGRWVLLISRSKLLQTAKEHLALIERKENVLA